MTDVHIEPIQERAEQIVQQQLDNARRETQAALDNAIKLESEVAKESEKKSAVYWKLARKDLDAEPTAQEAAAGKDRDTALARHMSTVDAVTRLRNKLAKLDDPAEVARMVRRQREKLEGLDRLAASRNNRNGGDMPEKTKRTPVDQKVIDRIVRDVKTKSQQEVADELNNEGIKTASGKPWTPQNIWHAVKKATGKGVPRKTAKANGGKKPTRSTTKPKPTAAKTTAKKTTPKKTTAKPLSRSAQASGTSRGGTGGKRKSSAAAKRVASRRRK